MRTDVAHSINDAICSPNKDLHGWITSFQMQELLAHSHVKTDVQDEILIQKFQKSVFVDVKGMSEDIVTCELTAFSRKYFKRSSSNSAREWNFNKFLNCKNNYLRSKTRKPPLLLIQNTGPRKRFLQSWISIQWLENTQPVQLQNFQNKVSKKLKPKASSFSPTHFWIHAQNGEA